MLRQWGCAFLLAALLVPPALAADTAPNPIKPNPIKPSFDCATAKSKINLLICSDANLAALDAREADMLRRARIKAVQPDGVNAEQDVWMQDRNACATVACLTRAYQRRIQELRAWVD